MKSNKLFAAFVISFMVLVLSYMCFDMVDMILFEPGRVEIAEIQLEIDGLSVKRVTINSPVIYFEIDDYHEFKALLKERNCTEIYSYEQSYYIFNEDLTIGWRIHYRTIYEVIDR